jgi:hypothetical protein
VGLGAPASVPAAAAGAPAAGVTRTTHTCARVKSSVQGQAPGVAERTVSINPKQHGPVYSALLVGDLEVAQAAVLARGGVVL